ncbi:unnamed protein product [Penicillium nalgiovense]|uniref:Laccase TilA n=1 Tax=Penicillium nalgiovense TaxID=60175 RepID=A0A9W4HYT0_PENNA|nr:unnamed protein product [Penicillium nalgiovense]CAG7964175.1 unnamed protein product [Penicillium nalgiovense]CAG7978502.1 unnamed protein product [Penicillium nalgiovense]CAG8004673.1 unnamed protein product [Penicillium nalgiovense]CAG8018118.1 unnamed protein product [Penicillium nalgiovense]
MKMATSIALLRCFFILTCLQLVKAVADCSHVALFPQRPSVKFDIVLTEGDISPDGHSRKGILTNGQFPAPLLELCQGDDVEVSVLNLLPYSITVHFHGIEQRLTPWSDGVPGLSQRGIKPRASFTYKWKATEYGSYFYHAHQRGHIEDGLYGPINIHPDNSVERPFASITSDGDQQKAMRKAEDNAQSIMLSDWRHLTSEQLWEAAKATGLDAYCTNSLLINGKGSVSCLSPDTINAFTSAAQKQVLNGSHLTDIGCIPPTNMAAQGPYPHNFTNIPDGLFSGCTPTTSHEGKENILVYPNAGYVSWNIISAAGVAALAFSVDEHPMYVYAVDGRYIEPVLTHVVNLVPGRRLSVLVKLDKPPGHYAVRSAVSGINQILNTTAVMSYVNALGGTGEGTSTGYIDIAGTNTTADVSFFDEKLAVPFPVELPAQTADQTFVLNIERFGNASYTWTLGNTSFPLALEEAAPLLFFPDSDVANSARTIQTKNGSWVDLIFHVTSPIQPDHPIHKHSNKFFLIGYGEGLWNYSSVSEAVRYIPQSFNFNTPPILDTVSTLPASTGPTWMAIRYQVNNPGAFLIHCHIQVHTSGGMALAILDGIDTWPEVPAEYRLS